MGLYFSHATVNKAAGGYLVRNSSSRWGESSATRRGGKALRGARKAPNVSADVIHDQLMFVPPRGSQALANSLTKYDRSVLAARFAAGGLRSKLQQQVPGCNSLCC